MKRKLFKHETSFFGEFQSDATPYRGPTGINMFLDIDVFFPSYNYVTIFDVGANTGETTLTYSELLKPNSIYSFEPISSSYKQLTKNTSDLKEVISVPLALTSKKGNAIMRSIGTSKTNRLINDSIKAKRTEAELVSTTTLDTFCVDNGIKK